MNIEIRPAREDEAGTLTEIAHEAKRQWGYPEEYIRLWRKDLTVERELEHFWVRPEAQSKGIGSLLFAHAVARSRDGGAGTLRVAEHPSTPAGRMLPVLTLDLTDPTGGNRLDYYITRTLSIPFDAAVDAIILSLKEHGFGVLTDIDVTSTLKNKLDVEFRNYRILGACNPPAAYRALQAEDRIGLLLPCNVIVQEHEPGQVEVAAIDPVAAMQVVDTPVLADIAQDIRDKLQKALDGMR
ncbi:GNAT family N-acetyltransferase [Candidatus Eisenbacteria bacterium]|uniref:GNAT family N-acetyltransferase n=1 Tax=Eiseniibacteriota bacterium TaxID=2212470 RepID=A0ABV6YJN8_UNCEI